jgi:hypothetical protein
MTVSQLIEELKKLPADMPIMVINEDRQDPVDIVTVSRGSWSDECDEEDIEPDYDSLVDPEFVQDDESGTVAVLVTW